MQIESIYNIILFVSFCLSVYGIAKLFSPKNSKLEDFFEFQKNNKISLSDILSNNIEKIENSIISKYTKKDSISSAFYKMEADVFAILTLFFPTLVLLVIIFNCVGFEKYVISFICFFEFLIAINRYSTFDQFSKLLENNELENAKSYIDSLPYINTNINLFQNFIFFPIIEIFVIYLSVFY